jgi:hypothetical protein
MVRLDAFFCSVVWDMICTQQQTDQKGIQRCDYDTYALFHIHCGRLLVGYRDSRAFGARYALLRSVALPKRTTAGEI